MHVRGWFKWVKRDDKMIPTLVPCLKRVRNISFVFVFCGPTLNTLSRSSHGAARSLSRDFRRYHVWLSKRFNSRDHNSRKNDLISGERRNHSKGQSGTTSSLYTTFLPRHPPLPCTHPKIMSPTAVETNGLADGRVGGRIENYTQFWQKDISKEAEVDTENRVDSYTEVVNGYYDGATELYEYGWAKSFHFSRFYKGEAFAASLARHEHYLAAQMNLRPGMKVLDVGCGVGGPAREIAQFTDARIVGLNNNDFQIQRARKYTKQAGLEGQVSFAKGDFMKLSEQFGENSFDAVYAIEATVHAPTWEGVYGEIMKVLKPGGVFGVYEWCMTDDWDPSIPSHKELAHEIEFGNGIPEMRPLRLARQALKTVGFEIEHEEDLANRPDEVPWYYPLEGDIRKAQTFWDYLTVWRMSWSGKLVSHNAMRLMEFVGLLPKGTWQVGEALKVAGDALVKGGQTKLFTPMYLVISRKPKN